MNIIVNSSFDALKTYKIEKDKKFILKNLKVHKGEIVYLAINKEIKYKFIVDDVICNDSSLEDEYESFFYTSSSTNFFTEIRNVFLILTLQSINYNKSLNLDTFGIDEKYTYNYKKNEEIFQKIETSWSQYYDKYDDINNKKAKQEEELEKKNAEIRQKKYDMLFNPIKKDDNNSIYKCFNDVFYIEKKLEELCEIDYSNLAMYLEENKNVANLIKLSYNKDENKFFLNKHLLFDAPLYFSKLKEYLKNMLIENNFSCIFEVVEEEIVQNEYNILVENVIVKVVNEKIENVKKNRYIKKNNDSKAYEFMLDSNLIDLLYVIFEIRNNFISLNNFRLIVFDENDKIIFNILKYVISFSKFKPISKYSFYDLIFKNLKECSNNKNYIMTIDLSMFNANMLKCDSFSDYMQISSTLLNTIRYYKNNMHLVDDCITNLELYDTISSEFDNYRVVEVGIEDILDKFNNYLKCNKKETHTYKSETNFNKIDFYGNEILKNKSKITFLYSSKLIQFDEIKRNFYKKEKDNFSFIFNEASTKIDYLPFYTYIYLLNMTKMELNYNIDFFKKVSSYENVKVIIIEKHVDNENLNMNKININIYSLISFKYLTYSFENIPSISSDRKNYLYGLNEFLMSKKMYDYLITPELIYYIMKENDMNDSDFKMYLMLVMNDFVSGEVIEDIKANYNNIENGRMI